VQSWTHAGLAANTQYAFQVCSTNFHGDSAKTTNYTTWTLAATPAAPVVGNADAHTLDVSIGSGDGNPAATVYAIHVSPAVAGANWVQADGSVGASPVYQNAAAWGVKTVTGLAAFTTYSFTVTARNGAGVSTSAGPPGSATTREIELPVALDNTILTWSTGMQGARWFGQTAVSHDGVDAGRSGEIADGQSSELTTQVSGPGTLSFWWKVSSEADHDFLRFSVDGVLQDRISGSVWFAKKAFNLGSGTHTLKWKYSKDALGNSGTDCAWLDEVSFVPNPSLCEALDDCGLAWSTTGNAVWFGQLAIASDGQDAAQSGAITHNQSSEFSTQVTGPGTLSFRWKVWSEAEHDFLRFSIDGVLKDRISGNVYFNQKQYTLGSGVHTLKWKYSKDTTGTAGTDTAWVDQVVWTPGGKGDFDGGLRIVSVEGGGWASLDEAHSLTVETEGGVFPLYYQWRKDDSDIKDATEAALTLK
jgi:hypothetical protein